MDILGFLDRAERVGELVMGYPILGTDQEIEHFLGSDNGFLVALGHLGSAEARAGLFTKAQAKGAVFPAFVTRDAFVDRTAQVGAGTIVMHRAFLNAGVVVGLNGIINTGAIIEHDAILGDHVHVSTGAVINGGVSLGSSSFVGSGVIIKQNIVVGPNVVVGAGAVVVRDLLEPGTYAGVPARRIK